MKQLPPVTPKKIPQLTLQNFRGLNNRDASTEIDDLESPDLLNINFAEAGSISKRYGCNIVGDDKGNTKTYGTYAAYFADGSAHLLMANQDTAVADDTGLMFRTTAGWSDAHDGAGFTKLAAADTEMESFYDGTDQVVFIADGTKYQKYKPSDNTLYDATAVPTDGEASNKIRVYKNRMYLAGPSTTLRERVWFSDLGDGDAWTAGNYFDVPSQAITQTGTTGDPITALAVYQDRLIIFKNRSVWYWDTTRLVNITMNHGCVGKRAFCLTDNYLYFADNDGVYRIAGNYIEKVSKKIKTTWSAIPAARMPEIAMGYFNGKVYVATAATGASTNNIILVNYINLPKDKEGQQPWSYWKGDTGNQLAVNQFAVYEASVTTLPILVFGCANAQSAVLQLETGNSDYDFTAGTQTVAIQSYYKTKNFNLNAQLRKIFAIYKAQSSASSLTITDVIDFETVSVSNNFSMFLSGTAVYGTGVYGTAIYSGLNTIIAKGNVSSKCKFVQFMIQNNSSSQPWTLYKLIQQFKPITLR
jgi:hypothetical protein